MNIHLTMGILTMAHIFPIHSTKILDWTISSKSSRNTAAVSDGYPNAISLTVFQCSVRRYQQFQAIIKAMSFHWAQWCWILLGPTVQIHRGLSWQCEGGVSHGIPDFQAFQTYYHKHKHHMGSAQKISECTSPYLGLWISLCLGHVVVVPGLTGSRDGLMVSGYPTSIFIILDSVSPRGRESPLIPSS